MRDIVEVATDVEAVAAAAAAAAVGAAGRYGDVENASKAVVSGPATTERALLRDVAVDAVVAARATVAPRVATESGIGERRVGVIGAAA